MPKEALQIKQFQGGIINDMDPKDVPDGALVHSGGFSVSELGRIKTLGGLAAAGLSVSGGGTDDDVIVDSFQSGYGLHHFSADYDDLSDPVGSGVKTVDSLTPTATGSKWQASQTHERVGDSASESDGSGTGLTCRIVTDGSGDVTFELLFGGRGYAVDEEITFTDPGSSSETATLVVASLNDGGIGGDGTKNTPTNYTLLTGDGTDNNNPKVFIHEPGDKWSAAATDLGTGNGYKPHFYNVGDGSLRIVDRTLNSSNLPFEIGYHHINYGGKANITTELLDPNYWVLKAVNILAPVAGTTNDSGGSNNSYKVRLFGATGSGAGNISASASASFWSTRNTALAAYPGGNWDSGSNSASETQRYRIHGSYVYSNGQESSLVDLSKSDGTGTLGSGAGSGFGMFGRSFQTQCYPNSSPRIMEAVEPRIVGFRFYWDKVPDSTENKFLLWDCHFEKGFRKAGTQSWLPVRSSNNHLIQPEYSEIISYIAAEFLFFGPPNAETFYTSNGYKDKTTVTALYKTAVYVNGRTYIGNVTQPASAEGNHYPDRMIRSPIGRPDIFPEDHYIDIEVSDGDEIVHLATFADRVLQFKNRSTFIWNVSQDSEFLEDTIRNGVSAPYQVCTFDKGVAWINEEGLFLYTGKGIVNATEKRISMDSSTTVFNWQTFISSTSMIGYSPKSKKLLIVKSIDNGANSSDMIIFDLKTNSFTYKDKGFNGTLDQDNKFLTNFSVDSNKDLIVGTAATKTGSTETITLYKWDDTSDVVDDNTNNYILTKEFDFGNVAQKKKIHKVLINWRVHTSYGIPNIKVYHGVDGVAPATEFSTSTSTNYGGSGLTGSGTNWIQTILKPSSSINNIYSFQLKLDPSGTVPANFEINDISIIFRRKRVN